MVINGGRHGHHPNRAYTQESGQGSLEPVSVKALVDTGAVHLRIPEHLAIQLDLGELEKRAVTLANGDRVAVPYVGPIEVGFKNRRCFTGAMVIGDEPLLGAIPMEDMDLVVVPSRQTIDVNPESPNIAGSLAKQVVRPDPVQS
ncbi:MAG: clan AA aspartic protease [Gammaproteobacteria bacterium]